MIAGTNRGSTDAAAEEFLKKKDARAPLLRGRTLCYLRFRFRFWLRAGAPRAPIAPGVGELFSVKALRLEDLGFVVLPAAGVLGTAASASVAMTWDRSSCGAGSSFLRP